MFKLPQYLRKKISVQPVAHYRKSSVKKETQNIIVVEYCPIFGISFRTVEVEWYKTLNYKI